MPEYGSLGRTESEEPFNLISGCEASHLLIGREETACFGDFQVAALFIAAAVAMAKQYAADIAMEVTTEAVQIHGGYGYVKEYHVERLMREAKLTQIYEGTSEVQKIIISRSLLKD